MRALWTGAITFGLVNVPIKLYSATEDHDLELHQVHDEDGGRIRYQRRCEVCGNIVSFDHINKAYEEDGRTVVITADDIKALPEEQSHEIDVVEFVPTDQIDPIRFDRSYFVEPTSKSTKAYTLLRRILEETERTAIVEFALRQRTRLAALRVYGDVILVHTLLWDDEVRQADFPALDSHPRISAQEVKLAHTIVDSMESDFDPSRFSDEYQNQLRTLVEAKLREGDSLDTAATFGRVEEEDAGGEVIDLMEALQRSVAARREKGSSTEKRKKA